MTASRSLNSPITRSDIDAAFVSLEAEIDALSVGSSYINMPITAPTGTTFLPASPTLLKCDTSMTITIALTAPGSNTGKFPWVIVDTANNANAKPITLQRAAAEKIDGVAADKVLDVSGGRWFLWTDGTDWYTHCTLPSSRSVSAGTGLTGGGSLAIDRTLSVNFGASGDIAAIGSAAAAGASGKVADAAHVHDGNVIQPSRQTTNFVASSTVGVYLVDTSAGNVTITLPAVSQRQWVIKKITTDTNKITLVPNGADNIEAANANYDLPNSAAAARGAWLVMGSTQASATGWWVS